ncbi:hypothetical protein [Larkinella harenae]
MKDTTALEIANTLPDTAAIHLLMLQESVNLVEAEQAKKIFQIRASIGQPMVLKLVCAIIKRFDDSLNTSERMTPLQVFEAGQLWIDSYPTESLKDLILCLKRAKTGQYGKIFNRVDVQVLSEFFGKYLQEKAEWRESRASQFRVEEGANQNIKLAEKMEELQLPDMLRDKIANRVKGTPTVETPPSPMSSYEQYLADLKKTIQHASEAELSDLRKQAAAREVSDVVTMIDEERRRRDNVPENLTEENL